MSIIKTPQELGLALRETRKSLDLTQSQLALAAGVGVRFIVELEAGKPTVRLESVLKVIHALGCDISLQSGLPQSDIPGSAKPQLEIPDSNIPESDRTESGDV